MSLGISDKTVVNRKELLKRIIQEKMQEGKSTPLSYAQQRLWFIYQLDPNNTAYNIHQAFLLNGDLKVDVLTRAVNKIVLRHESLRTAFSIRNGKPVQIISPFKPVKLNLTDLSNFPQDNQQREVLRLISLEEDRPFNLSQNPLFIINLYKLSESVFVFYIKIHHIITDGWSMRVFYQELSELYDAFLSNKPSPLVELPIQYTDYLLSQRQNHKDKIFYEQLSYWKSKLEGIPKLHKLPTDRKRPTVQVFKGDRVYIKINSVLTQNLKNMSYKFQKTLFTTLLSAFAILLYRYSNQIDLIIGTPIANRNDANIESLIGFFVNTLALRIQISPEYTFLDILSLVQKEVFEASHYCELPFEKIIEELQPARNLSYNPIVQIAFAFLNKILKTLELSGIVVTDYEILKKRTRFDLEIQLREDSNIIKGSILYNSDLFNKSTITNMIQHFQTILEGVVDNPDCRIDELPILTEAERFKLLIEWNKTESDFPEHLCIHELFEKQVKLSPETIAVKNAHQTITYRELNEKANELAIYLRELGVEPNSIVGILVDRSIEMVIGLLSILKAGGAYLPIDPIYPEDRINFIIKNSKVKTILTQTKYLHFVTKNCQFINLTTYNFCDENCDNLANRACPNSLAYIIYTSGSTGTPKGVLIKHGGVVNMQNFHKTIFGEKRNARMSQVSNIGFDALALEVWPCLLNGAELRIVPDELRLDPGGVKDWLIENKINISFQPTALAELLLKEKWSDNGCELIFLLTGGDKLNYQPTKKLPFALFNLYGPTEDTIWTSWTEILYSVKYEGSIIGKPVANKQIYILNQKLKPQPVNVPGELCISGAGLAAGYFNNEELTRSKFVDNPFIPGEKMYKTGDLARWLPDGNIEFLGRIDSQVKIRGFRIELGEIENILLNYECIDEAIVQDREEKNGHKYLCAYIIAQKEINVPDIKSYLMRKLSHYMIPSAYVFLKKLPLMANGKIDKKALPEPQRTDFNTEKKYVKPQDEVEEKIALIWKSLLDITEIGIDDNFFDVGGHSLIMHLLTDEIEKHFNKKIAIMDIFKYPTIRLLNNFINQKEKKETTYHKNVAKAQARKRALIKRNLIN